MSNLPKGWELVDLGSLCSITTGKLNANAMVENGKYKFFTCAKEPYMINEYKFDTEALLISGNGANVGYIHYYKGKFNAYQRTYVLDKFHSDIHFIKYILQRNLKKRIDKEKNVGNTPYITLDTITEMKISLPPLEEQKKIADILSTVDKKIAFVEENINITKELKKGLMQKLLTEGIGYTEFKDSELGRIPESWEIKTIDSIAKISGRIGYRGYTVADIVKEGEGAITLSPSNIINNKINFKNCTYISFFKYEESPEIKIYNGDILLVKTGSTYGKTAIVTGLNEKATLNPQIVVLKNIKMNNLYLSYLMSSRIIQNQISQTIAGGAIPTLSQKNIEKYKFPLPLLEEQKQIAEILSTVDNKLENLKEKKQSFEELKKGLMQKLLTGEVRV